MKKNHTASKPYRQTEKEQQRNYTPKYHIRYDPSAAQPRVEGLCLSPSPDFSHLREADRL